MNKPCVYWADTEQVYCYSSTTTVGPGFLCTAFLRKQRCACVFGCAVDRESRSHPTLCKEKVRTQKVASSMVSSRVTWVIPYVSVPRLGQYWSHLICKSRRVRERQTDEEKKVLAAVRHILLNGVSADKHDRQIESCSLPSGEYVCSRTAHKGNPPVD